MEQGLKNYFNLDFCLKYTLALFMLFMGFDKFIAFNLIFEFTGDAAILYEAIERAGFILPFIGIVEILAGILLIRKNTTPLGLVILLPFSVSVMVFHIFLAPAQIFPALLVFILNTVLLYRDRAVLAPIFHSISDGEDEVKESISKMQWVKKPVDEE